MDDFSTSSLHESRNEWCSRLITILTPLIIEGLRSIFDESYKLCKENNELDKYLMTFQNFISRIPRWNSTIIETERKRIYDKSSCNYLEELVTCVHIIQLKLLTAIRAGNKQKKIDINIPKFDDFIHKTYIHVARKIYKNVYLFELNIPPLQTQKNYRELEIIVQECILNSIRDSIPVEAILRAYMDESVEEDVIEEIKEQIIEDPAVKQEKEIINEVKNAISERSQSLSQSENNEISGSNVNSKLSFNDIDFVRNENGIEEKIEAPKDIQRLETISSMRNEQRKLEYEEDDENEPIMKLNISDQIAQLNDLDVHVINEPNLELLPDLLIDDIEILE